MNYLKYILFSIILSTTQLQAVGNSLIMEDINYISISTSGNDNYLSVGVEDTYMFANFFNSTLKYHYYIISEEYTSQGDKFNKNDFSAFIGVGYKTLFQLQYGYTQDGGAVRISTIFNSKKGKNGSCGKFKECIGISPSVEFRKDKILLFISIGFQSDLK